MIGTKDCGLEEKRGLCGGLGKLKKLDISTFKTVPSLILHVEAQKPHDFRLMQLDIQTGEVQNRHSDYLTIFTLIRAHIHSFRTSVWMCPFTTAQDYNIQNCGGESYLD